MYSPGAWGPGLQLHVSRALQLTRPDRNQASLGIIKANRSEMITG